MAKSIDIFANMVLSFNGEDISIDAEKNSIIMSSPFRSGLRTLLSMDEHHKLSQKVGELNEMLSNFGLTLHIRIGIFKIPVFGLKAGRGWLTVLFFFAHLGRTFGVL